MTHLHAMGRPYRSLPEGMAAWPTIAFSFTVGLRPYRSLPEGMAAENTRLARQGSAPGRHEWAALLRRLDRIAQHYRT